MSDTVAAPEPAPAPARSSASASSNWRDTSNWRRSEAPAPSPRPSRFAPTRTSGISWRDREEKKSTEDGQAAGDNVSRRLDPSDFIPNSRPYDRVRTNRAPQKDDNGAAKAIAEGRRIYIGNLRYQAKPEDIEGLLKDNDLGHFTNIDISVDPFTGRNPSYCFVDFPDADSAKKAMEVLEGKELLGREGKQPQLTSIDSAGMPVVFYALAKLLNFFRKMTKLIRVILVKCRPGQPKGSGSGGKPSEAPNRWGRWSGEKGGDDQSRPSSFDRYRQDFTGVRLYVGGLPRMHDQATNFAEMTELFKDYKL